jgi:hypothetical protein
MFVVFFVVSVQFPEFKKVAVWGPRSKVCKISSKNWVREGRVGTPVYSLYSHSLVRGQLFFFIYLVSSCSAICNMQGYF